MHPGAPIWIAVFVASGALVLYVVFGYPLLLSWLAKRRYCPVLKRLDPKTVTVIMAVRDGEEWIERKLRSILALNYPRRLMQILVISDGSTDGTDDIVRRYKSDGVELIRQPRRGKAEALNSGISLARGDILFFTDVRQTLDPDSLAKLVACFADRTVGVASGELVILDGTSSEEANVGLYWRYEKWIRKSQSRIDSVPGASGCIYAMRRQLAVMLPPQTLLDDVHLPMAALFRGYRIVLEDSARAYDLPTSLQSEFHRKVRTLAGNYQVISAYPKLLTPSNRIWLHFVSHKVGRLILPFALIALAASSYMLPAPWSQALVTAQMLFYGVAMLDAWMPDQLFLKRISSPVRTFVVLMAAALCAVAIFFVPGQHLWKTTRAGVVKAA